MNKENQKKGWHRPGGVVYYRYRKEADKNRQEKRSGWLLKDQIHRLPSSFRMAPALLILNVEIKFRRIVHWTTDKPLAVFIAAAVGEAQLSLAVVIVSSLTAYHAWFGKEESQMALVLKLI